MDRAILEETGVRRPSLLVLPTAAASENPTKAASNGVAYFSALGAHASSLMVLDSAHANDEGLLSPVDDVDVVYLTGGSPLHLLNTLVGSVLLRKINEALERGAVVAGSSAGAMVLGPWMRYRGWSKALGIVPRVVTLPHHERGDPDAVARGVAEAGPPDVAVVGIDGGTCCLGGPDKWRVLGQGMVTAYRAGGWRRLALGDVLTMDNAPSATFQ